MRKYSIVIPLLVFVNVCFSQNPEINTQLPTLVPPSPTVATLMKYEEIPVSNYTGIPNISIPLFSYKFPSNEIELNVGLSYHAANTKLDDVASDIGLGWSLTSGGSISRTVRDKPDESLGINKFGIYRDNTLFNINYYNSVQSMIESGNFNTMVPLNIVGDATPDNIKHFLWDVNAKGKYDIQHDLWQYNFNGHTGRFYIEKQPDGKLEVKLLENSNLKIINDYILPIPANNIWHHYKPTGFTIFDDKGYKYVFDVVEVSTINSFSESTAFYGGLYNNINRTDDEHNSSFHLSKIFDRNNQLLIEYKYQILSNEQTSNGSVVSHGVLYGEPIIDDINNVLAHFSELYSQNFLLGLYKPQQMVSSTGVNYRAKKISEINITGIGKVLFIYETGRLDENYLLAGQAKVLKEIIIRDSNDSIVKQYALGHEYIYATKSKLFLNKVTQIKGTELIDIYKLFYKQPLEMLDNTNTSKDLWGYLKKNDDTDENCLFKKEVDKDRVSMYALQKMVLPTGGSVVFDYESNTYSAIENEQLTNFDDNYYNWNFNSTTVDFDDQSPFIKSFFTITEAQDVCITASANKSNWFFGVYKETDPYNSLGGIDDTNPTGSRVLYNLQPGRYVVSFSCPIEDGTPNTGSITARFKTRKTTDYKNYLYGGGFRIAKITTYNQDVNVLNIVPQHETQKFYNYTIFNSPNATSGGVLVSKKPLFKTTTSMYRPLLNISFQSSTGPITLLAKNYGYDVVSNYDMINRGKTKGADIGYRNVSVSTLGNGRSEYTYTTSLEHPNIDYTIDALHLPSINMDYKRGLLLKEETFDHLLNRKLTTKTYGYTFDNFQIMTGLHVFGTYDEGYNNCPNFSLFLTYGQYQNTKAANCTPFVDGCSPGYFSEIFRSDLNLGYAAYLEAFGWAKLTSVNNKEYFYNNASAVIADGTIETIETYTYNPINKKIAEKTVTNSNLNEIMKTKYFYHTGNSTFSQNRISEIERIETYKNNDLLSTSKIVYTNDFAGNASYLPRTIQTAKSTQALENRLKYNAYDEFGHPLEVSQQNGTVVSYIWGYNKTQPVAKLENATYDEVQPYVGNLQDLSNSTNETNLITALNALRTAFPNAMITTYTYKPLIGISTVTDPKGDTQTYHYDEFNRLQFVKDSEDNILSENAYHYRTPN